ncbi:MAG: DUF11 domain-containing protein [Planctomycetota bacterium]|nr:MAG: DUF11 domain-containing protein [Planctomycetota bacterium]
MQNDQPMEPAAPIVETRLSEATGSFMDSRSLFPSAKHGNCCGTEDGRGTLRMILLSTFVVARWIHRCRLLVPLAIFGMFIHSGGPGLRPHGNSAWGQAGRLPHVYYPQDARQVPGSIGAAQVARGLPGMGSFQPVSLRGPAGLKIALAQDGALLPLLDAPVNVGMIVGAVYRFQVGGIPLRPGAELYPTLEIIDHVHAPAERAHRFPVPVVLTREDLELALRGALITRVIYLEDSDIADPEKVDPEFQITTTVGPEENALQVADQLGRPVAILRIGSRLPPQHGDLHSFLFGSPPWVPLPVPPRREQLIESGMWPADADQTPSPSDSPHASNEPVERIPLTQAITPPLPCPVGCEPTFRPGGQVAADGDRHVDPHAYIYDGGDAAPLAQVREDWTPIGLKPSETIAFYDTVSGRVCVRSTNRVAVYAPRFAAIRQVAGVIMTAASQNTQGILDPVATGRIRDANQAGAVMQPVALHGQQQVGLIDALEDSNFGAKMDQVVPLQRMSDARFAIEGFDVTTTSRITDDEIVVLGRILQNAYEWWSPESLEVYLNGQGTALAKKSKAAQEVFHYEVSDSCALRVLKGASSSVALPGDILRFTLRFDNVGTKPIGNVVLVDNLTTRLEYIEGSQQSSVPVRFSSEPNSVGSQQLRWELEEPLAPYSGGVISFDCKVR